MARQEERQAAASLLFNDPSKRTRVLSALQPQSARGHHHTSHHVHHGAVASTRDEQPLQDGGVGPVRRMRAMQDATGGHQGNVGTKSFYPVDATGGHQGGKTATKYPGDYHWKERGPGIRRENNFEFRAGHFPVSMSNPFTMPPPKAKQ